MAWVEELKGILSLLLALVSVLFYLRYDRDDKFWRYAAAIAAFCLSTLSKGMVITLPIVLIACVWWRPRLDRAARSGANSSLRARWPLMAGLEIRMQKEVQGDDIIRSDGLFGRVAVAGCAVWFYLGKLLWPLNLCFIYPQWKIEERDLVSYLPGLLLVVLFAAGVTAAADSGAGRW